jgi:RNase P/RNase MRP subunit p30
MEFADLNLCCAELCALERRLGFSFSFCLQNAAVNSQAEMQKKLGKPSAVESSSVELLMASCRNPNTVLVNPFPSKGFEKEPKLFRKVADEGKAIEIPLSMLLEASGNRRAGRMHVAARAVGLARKHGAPVVITSRATCAAGCRSPFEIAAIATAFLGMAGHEAKNALSKNALECASQAGLSPL